MLPPSEMLATKNWAGRGFQIFFLLLAVLIAGCTPPGPRAFLDGKRLLEEGKYPQAVEKLKIATSLLTTNAQAWNYLGLACHRAGQSTNAALAYKRALDLNRDLLEARYNLGCLWLDQNKLDAAKAEFTAYTLRRGNAAEGWLKLGTAQLRARETTGAERSFREALRVSPQNVEALNGLGLVQLQRNRPREAVQFFGDALKRSPQYRPALLNLATVLGQHLNDRPGALQRYREYLALKPKSADWEAVNAIARSLDQQLTPLAPTPPPRPPRTNPVPHAIVNTNVIRATTPTTATVARVLASPRAEPPPALPKASPPPPPANTAPVELVQLSPEPVIKTSPDALPPPPVPTSNQSPPVEPASPVSSPVVPNPAAKSDQPGFLSRLFRREPKSPVLPTPLPPSKASASAAPTIPKTRDSALVNAPMAKAPSKGGTAVSTRATAAPAADARNAVAPPSFSRYAYLSPSKPAAGNRRDAERAFAQGQQAHRANRLAEALQAYQQATVLDASYFEAHYNLGLAAYESRSYRQALAAWENALAVRPESNDARYNFALALKASNHPLDAANELEKILAANPKEARAHLVLGNLCAEQLRDPARARAHYVKVLELEPRHPQATAIRYWLVNDGNP